MGLEKFKEVSRTQSTLPPTPTPIRKSICLWNLTYLHWPSSLIYGEFCLLGSPSLLDSELCENRDGFIHLGSSNDRHQKVFIESIEIQAQGIQSPGVGSELDTPQSRQRYFHHLSSNAKFHHIKWHSVERPSVERSNSLGLLRNTKFDLGHLWDWGGGRDIKLLIKTVKWLQNADTCFYLALGHGCVRGAVGGMHLFELFQPLQLSLSLNSGHFQCLLPPIHL